MNAAVQALVARPRLAVALAVLAAAGVSLWGGFVWDDRPLIVENPMLDSRDGVASLLASSFWETADRFDRFRAFYRPAVTLTFALDRALWGERAVGFHLTNLLLHLGCCLLIRRLALDEGLPPAAALAGALLFAVHPVHVESVAWISGRTDLLSALAALASFAAWRRAERAGRPGLRLASALAFGVALFAKEMAITLPVLFALDAWRRAAGPGLGPRAVAVARATWAPTVVAAGYLAARTAVLGRGAEPLFALDPLAHALTAVFVLARYVTLLVFPLGLDAHYPYAAVGSALDPRLWLGAAILAVAVLGVRRLTAAGGPARFWALWIGVTLAPVMSFGRFGDVLLADRFLYLPSAGLALLAAHGVARCGSGLLPAPRRRAALAVVAGALALLTAVACARSVVWLDERRLFEDMARTSPASALVRNNLGLSRYDDGRIDEAVAEFRTAVELAPGFALAHNNLAAALERRGDHDGALAAYADALRHAPGLAEAQANAGQLLVRIGRHEVGLALLRTLVKRRPGYGPGRYALASALVEAGRPAEALAELDRLLAERPDTTAAWYLRGKLLWEAGRADEAAASMTRFIDGWTSDDAWLAAARRVVRAAAERPGPPPRS